MRSKQKNPQKTTKIKRGLYNKENLFRAYRLVKDQKYSVHRAANQFNIPVQTLRDRVKGKIDINTTKPGPESLFTHEEELTLVEHIETMAQIGYGVTHSQLKILGSELAVALGKREKSSKMSNCWVSRFLKRWQDRLASKKPSSLESCRAKSSTQEIIDNYYVELERIMKKYNLEDKPHMIFNVDETGLKPDHKPPHIIAPSHSKPNTVTSPKGSTVTLYGCVSAIGQTIPPYFVFKGVRAYPELLNGALPGSGYCMSESGWGNSDTFMKFLEEHFLKYTQAGPNAKDYTLLLYDGHSLHVSKKVVDWANRNKIITFILPPHTSHLTQPLDVGCFGPFKKFYHSECDLWMKSHLGQTMTRYEICEVACKAYQKAMTIKNITAAFKTVGIYPLSKTAIPNEKTYPSEPFRGKNAIEKVKALKGGREEVEKFLQKHLEEMQAVNNVCGNCKKRDITKENQKIKKPSPGGKAITENDFIIELDKYEHQKTGKKTHKNYKKSSLTGKRTDSPKPSTSGVSKDVSKENSREDIESDNNQEEIDDSEKCCVCGLFEPKDLSKMNYIFFVNWANCSKCGHWVHLKFCSAVSSVRRNVEFLCPHCI